MATKKLSKQEALDLLAPFVLGILSNSAIVNEVGSDVGIELPTNSVVLHADDYELLNVSIVQFFMNRPFKITELPVKARINAIWSNALSSDSPVTPSEVSTLEDPIAIEY